MLKRVVPGAVGVAAGLLVGDGLLVVAQGLAVPAWR